MHHNEPALLMQRKAKSHNVPPQWRQAKHPQLDSQEGLPPNLLSLNPPLNCIVARLPSLPLSLSRYHLHETRATIIPPCIKIISCRMNQVDQTIHNGDHPSICRTRYGGLAPSTSLCDEWLYDTQSNGPYRRIDWRHHWTRLNSVLLQKFGFWLARICKGTSVQSLTSPVPHYVYMYSLWSLYISDHICTTPTSSQ
jgi:hypothetical protein